MKKGKCNFYLFADDMTVYTENPKVYSKEYLKLLKVNLARLPYIKAT